MESIMKKLFLVATVLSLAGSDAHAGVGSERQPSTPPAGTLPVVASSLGTIRLQEPGAVRIFLEQPRLGSSVTPSHDPLRKAEEYARSNPLMGGGGGSRAGVGSRGGIPRRDSPPFLPPTAPIMQRVTHATAGCPGIASPVLPALYQPPQSLTHGQRR
jgi:hypothetical protein